MRTDSSMFEQFTLGIEEEFQIVDPQTRELRSHVSEILEDGKMLLGEQVKPEMIQSMIEVGTGVCGEDRKSTRLNSSHLVISYAVFCSKKKKETLNKIE